MHSFLCLGFLREIYFLCWQAEIISDLLLSKQLSFSSKHKLHLLDPPVKEIDFFIIDHFMVKSVLF